MEKIILAQRSGMVALVQSALSRIGAYDGEINGLCGFGTLAALESFSGVRAQAGCAVVPDTLLEQIYGFRPAPPGCPFEVLAARFDTDLNLLSAAREGIVPLRARVISSFVGVPFGSDIGEIFSASLLNRFALLRRVDFGESVRRKRLYAFELGSGKEHILLCASLRGSESQTGLLLLALAEELLYRLVGGGAYGGLGREELNRYTLSFIALPNPDGADIASGELGMRSGAGQYAQAITLPPLSFPKDYAANARGVELALNFAPNTGSANRPAAVGFAGKTQLSEPESRALHNYHSFFAPSRTIYFSGGFWRLHGAETAFSELSEAQFAEIVFGQSAK